MIRNFMCFLLILFSIFFVNADNGVWHYAQDIKGGIFGADEVEITNFTFRDKVYFTNSIYTSIIFANSDLNYFLNLNENSNLNSFSSNIGIVKNLTIKNKLISEEIEVIKGLKLGFESICDLSKEGILRYNSSIKQMEFCNGEIWSSFNSGSGSGIEFVSDLVNFNHTKIECEAEGGEVVAGDVEGIYMCRFDSVTCPTEWNQYEEWSTTNVGSTSCTYKVQDFSWSIPYSKSCSRVTTSHPWSNTPIEIGGGRSCTNCNPPSPIAVVTQIGCY